MTNFFTRLAARTLGLTSVVQPLMTSMFAPDSIMPSDYSLGFETKFDSLDTNVPLEETQFVSSQETAFPISPFTNQALSQQTTPNNLRLVSHLVENESNTPSFSTNEGELARIKPQVEQGNKIQRFAANPPELQVNFERQDRQTPTPANSPFVQPPVSENRQIETNMRSPDLIANNIPINSDISNPFVQQGIAATPVQQISIEQGNEIQRFAANPPELQVNFEQQNRQTQTPANSSFVQLSVSGNREIETNMRSPDLIANNTPINSDISNPFVQQGIAATPVQQISIEQGNEIQRFAANPPELQVNFEQQNRQTQTPANSSFVQPSVSGNREIETNMRSPNLIANNTPINSHTSNPLQVRESKDDSRLQTHESLEKSSNKSQNLPTNSIFQQPEGEMRSQVSSTIQNPVAARRQSTDANSIVPAQPPASLKLNQDAQNTPISTSHLGHSLVSRLNQRLSAPKLAVVQPIVNTRNTTNIILPLITQSPIPNPQSLVPFTQLPSVLSQPSFRGERFNSVVHQNREARQLEATNQSDASSIPTIQITIGRIEVRASTPPASKVPKTKSTQQLAKLGLSDYLKQRDGGKL